MESCVSPWLMLEADADVSQVMEAAGADYTQPSTVSSHIYQPLTRTLHTSHQYNFVRTLLLTSYQHLAYGSFVKRPLEFLVFDYRCGQASQFQVTL